jgi:5,10-methylenetetrahydrofolate reductase
MKLTERFQKGQYVVTSEVAPPKGADVSGMLRDADTLRDKVHGINVTDQQGAVMKLGSLGGCRLLKERGLEPIFQLTCRDRNRIALQSDLLTASAFGVENVLCLTGDHVTLGDHPQAKPVFDLDSVSLLHAASELKQGRDLAGNALEGAPDFDIGCVVSPAADPLDSQLYKLERKVKAGAQFIQTQAVYDPRTFEDFMHRVQHLNVPVVLGIVLLKSARMARFMNRHVAGIQVPDHLIEEMESAGDKAEASVEISARLIRDMRPMCQGVHLMTLDWVHKVPAILDAAGLAETV